MGAELWHHEAPWRSDPGEALFALQVRFLAEKYNLRALVQGWLESARESVRITEAEGDPYDLLDLYRAHLAMLEVVSSRALPDDPRLQIELVRKIYTISGQGIGNILDVTGISDQRELYAAQRLNHEETARLVGATCPTIDQARHAIDKINEELGRAECVCFTYYDEGDAGKPAGWYFVGNTLD